MGALKEKAIVIRDEEKQGANTAPRVGGLLVEMAELLENNAGGDIKKIILTRGTNDYSELDAYNSYGHLGMYIVCRNTDAFIIGKLSIYASWGGTIVQELESFKMSGTGTAIHNTTRMTRTKWSDDTWTEWKSYQSSFIGSDKVSAGGWTEEDVAPSVKEFKAWASHMKVVEWSGIMVSDVNISLAPLPSEAIYINPPTAADIFFDDVKKSFCVLYDEVYYVITSLSQDFQETIGGSAEDWSVKLKKNYFRGLNNTTWVAVSDTEISPLVDNIFIMPGNIKPFLDKIDRGEYPSLSSDEIRALCGGKSFFEAVETHKIIMSADGVVFTEQSSEKQTLGWQATISYNYPLGTFGSLTLAYAGPEPDTPESELKYSFSYPDPFKIKDNIYQMPGDITTMGNSLDYSIIGPAADLLKAMNSNKLIMSKGRVVQCNYDGNENLNIIIVEYAETEYIENNHSPVLYKKVWVTNRQFLSLGNYKKYKLALTEA